MPKCEAADAQTPLTGTAAPSAAPQPLQGSAAFSTFSWKDLTLGLGYSFTLSVLGGRTRFYFSPQHLENEPCKVSASPAGIRTELRDLCSGRIGSRCAQLGGYFSERGPFLGVWFCIISTLGTDFRRRRGISGSGGDWAEREKSRKTLWILSPPNKEAPNVVLRDSPAVLQWIIFKLGFSLLTLGACVKDAQRSEGEGDESERGGRFRQTFPETLEAGVFQVYFCKPRCICCLRGSYTCKCSTTFSFACDLRHSCQQKSPKASYLCVALIQVGCVASSCNCLCDSLPSSLSSFFLSTQVFTFSGTLTASGTCHLTFSWILMHIDFFPFWILFKYRTFQQRLISFPKQSWLFFQRFWNMFVSKKVN